MCIIRGIHNFIVMAQIIPSVVIAIWLGVVPLAHARIESAGALLTAQSRISGAVVRIVTEWDKIVCITGLRDFPDTVKKVTIHPTNKWAYEITDAARKPSDGKWANITPKEDYLIIKNREREEIAKWSVQGNKFSHVPLSVFGVLEQTNKCNNGGMK